MNQKLTTVQWVSLLAVFAALVWAMIAFGWHNMYGEQYQQFNQELQRVQQDVRLPGEYEYVADMETRLYWPYEKKYVDAIPRERRVYILDAGTLEQFKGYKPGPL